MQVPVYSAAGHGIERYELEAENAILMRWLNGVTCEIKLFPLPKEFRNYF